MQALFVSISHINLIASVLNLINKIGMPIDRTYYDSLDDIRSLAAVVVPIEV